MIRYYLDQEGLNRIIIVIFQVHLPSSSTRSVECGNETVTLAPNDSSFLPNLSSSGLSGCGGSFSGEGFPMDLFTCLLPVIEQAHAIWELVLTAEPLVVSRTYLFRFLAIAFLITQGCPTAFMLDICYKLLLWQVMASNPTVCSSTVQYLTSIIYPLSYCADYRPFYTIHDSDFKEITRLVLHLFPNASWILKAKGGCFWKAYIFLQFRVEQLGRVPAAQHSPRGDKSLFHQSPGPLAPHCQTWRWGRIFKPQRSAQWRIIAKDCRKRPQSF